MSGFAIFNIEVKKPVEYKKYVEKVKPIAEKFGGEYIVRGGETRVLEGTWVYPRTCLLYTSPSPRDKRQSRMPSSA